MTDDGNGGPPEGGPPHDQAAAQLPIGVKRTRGGAKTTAIDGPAFAPWAAGGWDEVLDFACERHRVFEARQAGADQPWTDNPIFGMKLTNVFRALDPGTQFILTDLAEPGLPVRDMLARLALYRRTGLPSVWRRFRDVHGAYPRVADVEAFARVLGEWQARGETVFTGVYRVGARAGMSGLDNLVVTTRAAFDESSPKYVGRAFARATRQTSRFGALTQKGSGLGKFFAMQVLTDFGYLGEHDLENEFVAPGPGAEAGAKLVGPTDGAPTVAIITKLRDALHARPDCPTWAGRKPSLMDCQNVLCEWSKAVRASAANRLPVPYVPAHPGAQPVPVLPSWWTTAAPARVPSPRPVVELMPARKRGSGTGVTVAFATREMSAEPVPVIPAPRGPRAAPVRAPAAVEAPPVLVDVPAAQAAQDPPAAYGLTVPYVECRTVLEAALGYAAAGWYVLPVKAETKHAGSVLGDGWPEQTSRNPARIRRWFDNDRGHLLALHVGRSGAVVLDVDNWAGLDEAVRDVVMAIGCPFQATRVGDPFRGHYVFAMPEGRVLGNGGVRHLGTGWGEIRGRNGIIVVAPSPHPNAAAGGLYAWEAMGRLDPLPAAIADLLPEAGPTVDAAGQARVDAAAAEWVGESSPRSLAAVEGRFRACVAEGRSRHDAATEVLPWAAREARAGLYPLPTALGSLEELFHGGPKGENPPEEWAGLVSWAVGAALAEPEERLAEIRLRALGFTDQGGEALGPAPTPAEVAERWPLADVVGLLDPNRTPRAWLLDGIVPAGDHVSIVAPGGVGKSLLVLGMSIAALRGDGEFAGRILRPPRRVLHIDKENSDDDWSERLTDLGVTQDLARRWLADGRWFPMSLPRLRGLDTERGAADLVEILDGYGLDEHDLVILDSTQRVTEGPENDNDTLRNLYNYSVEELKRRKLTVIRTDNTGKDPDRGARGASAKRDDVGYSWILTKRGGSYVLTDDKHRGRKDVPGGQVVFALERDDCGFLRFVAASPAGGGPDGPLDDEVVRRVAAFLAGLPEGHAGASRNFVRREVAGNNGAIDAALAFLVREGYASRVQRGQATLHRLVRPYEPGFEELEA